MTKEEFMIKMLPLVMALDRRLQVHSFFEVDGIWQHTNKCPRCAAMFILGIESDLKLSTGKDLQKDQNCDTIRRLQVIIRCVK